MIYTAITIGPIYDTFSQAKRTRSIWAASYFFSMFMRKILEGAIAENWDIILPYSKMAYKGEHGAGLYADRLYFKNKSKEDVQNKVNNVIDFFADDFVEQKICADRNQGLEFLTRYLNTHIVEIVLTEAEIKSIEESKDAEGRSNNSILKILNDLLDNKELNKQYVFDFDNNYLNDYFSLKWNANSELKTEAFNGNKRHFTSIGEIATNDLKNKYAGAYQAALNDDFRNEDIEFIDRLSKKMKENSEDKGVSIIEEYHKYYAVLYADGDNIGALLKEVANDNSRLQTFSKQLLDFGLKAEQSIADYGGSAIYMGGEDILAFLPIAYKDGNGIKSLAALIKNLDKDFYDTLGQYAAEQKVARPTLSYGLMLAYYKFPMKEAMQQAHDLLEASKQQKKVFPYKNGVSVRFQKHSGQYMECFIDKSKKNSTKQIYNLLTTQLQLTDKKDILSGLIQRLKDDVFFTIFIHAVRNGRIDSFFENFFNEGVHASKETFTDLFKELAKALKADYLKGGADESEIEFENERVRRILFTVLRYYQFIQ